jgi:RND family efflux transporter MFP subunit
MPIETAPDSSARRGTRWAAWGLLALAVAVVATGLWSRRSQATALREGADARRVPAVVLVQPAAAAGDTIDLPGRIEAWARAPIYARVSGYLKRYDVDIGGHVKARQALAEIETPDLDQQLLQARAELVTARSNAALAASTSQRWQSLLATDSVSRQEADEKAGDLAAKQSVVNALQANVERVQALQRYTRLVAPFDGVVTARNTDVGALIGVGGAPGSELFVVSDVRRLRVYVNVPQRQVAMIRPGATARLSVPEHPGRTWPATVQSRSQAIASGSGAMLVQLAVDNDAGDLLSGGYATVRFDTPRGNTAAGALSLPPSALIIGKAGVQVATLDGEDRVRLKPVTVSRDRGDSIELASGVAATDRVIDSPPDGLLEGARVRIVTAAAPAASKKAAP